MCLNLISCILREVAVVQLKQPLKRCYLLVLHLEAVELLRSSLIRCPAALGSEISEHTLQARRSQLHLTARRNNLK